MKHFFTLILLILLTVCNGQKLEIHNGYKSKIFKANTYYELTFANAPPVRPDCCDFIRVEGKLVRILPDSIVMDVSLFEQHKRAEAQSFSMINHFEKTPNQLKFSKQDLAVLTGYKNKNSFKRRRIKSAFGGFFVFSGLVTAINTFFIDKDDRDGFWIAAGSQVALGTILLSTGPKKYQFKGTDDPWTFQSK